MTATKYRHLLHAIYGAAWAIYPPTLAQILDVVSYRAQGGRLTDEEVDERIAAAQPNGPRTGRAQGAVAVIPLYGIIAPRAAMFDNTSTGGTGLDRLTAQFRAAMADPDISAVAFDIDSPGGTVDGVEELAAEIRARRGEKPISAVANFMAASAAYYLAAQADEIVVSPSGQVGSIGVLAAHEDISEALAQAGVKISLITHGKYKAESNPYEPLSDEARAMIQDRVDEYGAMFEAAVAKGRGITAAKVRAEYGQGRMMLAQAAKSAGLADRVDTLEGTIARLGAGKVKAQPAAGAAAFRIQLGALDDGYAAIQVTTPAGLRELTPIERAGLAAALAYDPEPEPSEARTTTRTTTTTETVTEDDDAQGDQDAESIDDNATEPQAAQATGPTFSARMTAVTAEAEELASIARQRADRRTDRKHPLSASHRAQLRALGTSLLATAAAEWPEAQDEPAASEPGATVKLGPSAQIALAAAAGGYRLNPDS